MHSNASTEAIERFIIACKKCAAVCDHCAVMSQLDDNEKKHQTYCRIEEDCAAVCRLTASILASSLRWQTEICELCIQLCIACANACADYTARHYQYCAQVCLDCVSVFKQVYA